MNDIIEQDNFTEVVLTEEDEVFLLSHQQGKKSQILLPAPSLQQQQIIQDSFQTEPHHYSVPSSDHHHTSTPNVRSPTVSFVVVSNANDPVLCADPNDPFSAPFNGGGSKMLTVCTSCNESIAATEQKEHYRSDRHA